MVFEKTAFRSRAAGICGGIILGFALALAPAAAQAPADEDMWPGIRKDLYADRMIAEDDGAVALEAPVRADDAAVVPITMKIPAEVAAKAKALTLVIEKNPMPVAATFTFGPAAGVGERMISTRVRVDMYSNVRAVLETTDGNLHMATKFVKAAGGCSAPALKDAEQALAQLGKMKLRLYEANQTPLMPEAQVMIRHPNYSGMQMNQLTGLYIPAKYVQSMEVKRGNDVIFTMEGGISLSENPNIRFTYGAGDAGEITVTAKDTDGSVFTVRHNPKGS
ncbi:MAG: quinoprotein dehydrogenase-associated SoxYZ-like carrier [Hyphomicrobiaceae bacterium]|nr:quinoprotein dehydrogenase-associated SoxYZ-like carrier [Hyphomicrobiaceae bacterium]